MKKRILQFIGSFHQGGSERQALSLTRLLKTEGSFEIFAATLNSEGVLREEFDRIGLPAIPEYPLTSFYNANFVGQLRRCAHFMRDNKIDLVHTHDFYTNVFGMAAATLADVPARVASKREGGEMRSLAQEFFEKLSFGRAGAIVANSESVRARLVERSIAANKIHVIYNGVDPGRFEHVDRDRAAVCRFFGLPTDENIRFITIVANLRHRVKNIPMLLRAAKLVGKTHRNAHFVIAGEGELESELRAEANIQGVANNVHFIGRCTDVPALLSVSYVCALTSSAEGFSNSILEYMAAGKAVVATRVGGAAEAISEGATGYMVASDDDAAMAARLMELLADEKKSSSMGAEGKRIAAARFSSETQLQRTIDLYNSVLTKYR